jgi:hypothetical protein
MTGKDLFGVVVRGAGLYCIVRGLQYLAWVFNPSTGWAPADYLMSSLAQLGLGCVILAGANPIVAFAYRTDGVDDDVDHGAGAGVWTGPDPDENPQGST